MLATLSLLLLTASAPHVRSISQPEVRLGETLALRVDNLDAAQCKSFVLYLDGKAIDGLTPDCSRAGEVRFTLAVNKENAEAWHALFARAPGCCRNVSVSAGTDVHELGTDVLDVPMRIINRVRWLITIVLGLLAVVAMLFLRWRTGLLHNLPRMQIACFALAIGIAYGYIWSTTGEAATVNGSALTLLGIGLGTAAGSAILSSGKRVSVTTAVKALANEGVEAPVETAVRFDLHSLQAAVWTAVIAFIVIAGAYRELEMPDLSEHVFAILGISAGTYLALSFKKR
ncbi:MAG TPA: hypothetical protein VGR95_05965 [Thermoanaerobaculia bacterium]|jgi:hypothetical protein|nr:hypothetical protein [Thermoanaerobaculia bacterium]